MRLIRQVGRLIGGNCNCKRTRSPEKNVWATVQDRASAKKMIITCVCVLRNCQIYLADSTCFTCILEQNLKLQIVKFFIYTEMVKSTNLEQNKKGLLVEIWRLI